MNQQQSRTIDILNQLYAAECRSLLPWLAKTGVFVSWATAADVAVLRQMVEEEREHLAWLVEALDRCHGTLYPVGPDPHTGHLNYLDLQTLLPRVVHSVETLIKVYQEAGRQPLADAAIEIVNRILQRHQRHLEQLKKLQDRAVTARA